MDEDKTTTWGDCPNRDCMEYGKMVYGITPGDICEPSKGGGCYQTLRWWDRWHDGKHYGESGLKACRAERKGESE